jgi:hypothetical protein
MGKFDLARVEATGWDAQQIAERVAASGQGVTVQNGSVWTLRPRRKEPPDALRGAPHELPLVLTLQEAAGLLRTTVGAVYARVERGQLTGAHGLIRNGRRMTFHRDRLLASLQRDTDGRGSRRGRKP